MEPNHKNLSLTAQIISNSFSIKTIFINKNKTNNYIILKIRNLNFKLGVK